MPLDHYANLGNSGLRVSPFCLGAMTFGEDWGWGASEADSFAVLDRYLDLGGNFIDTANFYTKGHSEKIIGDFFAASRGKRQKAVIATKFFSSLYTGDPNGGGASRKSITAALENSLRRLRTEYVDLYWLHCWDRFTPIEETMRCLDDLVHAGKVRYIGFSDTPAWKTAQAQMIATFRGWTPLCALQLEYSLLERTVEGELLPMARELGLGVTPWSPLRSGVLSGKYTRETRGSDSPGRGAWVTSSLSDKAYDIIDILKKIAAETGSEPARVALAWLQAQPGVTSTIIGVRSLAQLEDNLGGLDLELSDEHMDILDTASRPSLNFPAEFVDSVGPFGYGGTTINGETFPVNPLAPKCDDERF
jgi:aryl-alcohol dehydrogenase-like predicted oxidoreductase